MSNSQGQFVLLWSKAKNSIDVKSLEACLSANRQAYKDNAEQGDWLPLYVGDKGTVSACALNCSQTLLARENGWDESSIVDERRLGMVAP